MSTFHHGIPVLRYRLFCIALAFNLMISFIKALPCISSGQGYLNKTWNVHKLYKQILKCLFTQSETNSRSKIVYLICHGWRRRSRRWWGCDWDWPRAGAGARTGAGVTGVSVITPGGVTITHQPGQPVLHHSLWKAFQMTTVVFFKQEQYVYQSILSNQAWSPLLLEWCSPGGGQSASPHPRPGSGGEMQEVSHFKLQSQPCHC